MPTKDIIEVENKSYPRDQKPIKERMDINILLVIAESIQKEMGQFMYYAEVVEVVNHHYD